MEDQEKVQRECFGTVTNQNSQKCLGCLDRGPCGRSRDDDDDSAVPIPKADAGS